MNHNLVIRIGTGRDEYPLYAVRTALNALEKTVEAGWNCDPRELDRAVSSAAKTEAGTARLLGYGHADECYFATVARRLLIALGIDTTGKEELQYICLRAVRGQDELQDEVDALNRKIAEVIRALRTKIAGAAGASDGNSHPAPAGS